jgi:hypothetical protein
MGDSARQDDLNHAFRRAFAFAASGVEGRATPACAVMRKKSGKVSFQVGI